MSVQPRGITDATHTPARSPSPGKGRPPQNLPRARRRRPRRGAGAHRHRLRPGRDDGATAGVSSASQPTAAAGDGKVKIPDDLKDRLKEHGIDLDKWKDGAWKNWDKDDWLREADDYVNPIIKGLWDPDRMRDADEPGHGRRRQRHLR